MANEAFDCVKKAVKHELSKEGDKAFDPFEAFVSG
jgi:hypothetical protein